LPTATDTESHVGRAPRSPERLSATEWLAALKRSFSEFRRDDCMGLSQQIAYSSLLAFFPATAFVVGALGLFHLFDDVKRLLDPIAPSGVIRFISSLQHDSKGGTSAAAFVIGLFGAVWAASGAMSSVIKAVNAAYDRQETRPFWKVRGIAILLVVSSGITTAGIFLLIVVGGALGDAIAKKAHLGGAFNWTWGILRWPVAFCAILLFFGLVYYLAPNKEQRSWKWITPGSLVGGVLWLILSGLFALYVTYAGHYTKTYGALASGVILLLWLNYSAFALLYGAELNSELDRQADIHAGQEGSVTGRTASRPPSRIRSIEVVGLSRRPPGAPERKADHDQGQSGERRDPEREPREGQGAAGPRDFTKDAARGLRLRHDLAQDAALRRTALRRRSAPRCRCAEHAA
jgi:membrane protein